MINNDYPVAFRLPKKMHALAEEYLIESGEKNLNAVAQKLLVAEIEKRHLRDENCASKFDGENTEFLLAAVGNLRELFRRAFGLLFDPENGKAKYEDVVEEMQRDWSALNEIFFRRTAATDARSDDFTANVETEVDALFEMQLIDPAPENFAPAAVADSANKSPEILRQASLFD